MLWRCGWGRGSMPGLHTCSYTGSVVGSAGRGPESQPCSTHSLSRSRLRKLSVSPVHVGPLFCSLISLKCVPLSCIHHVSQSENSPFPTMEGNAGSWIWDRRLFSVIYQLCILGKYGITLSWPQFPWFWTGVTIPTAWFSWGLLRWHKDIHTLANSAIFIEILYWVLKMRAEGLHGYLQGNCLPFESSTWVMAPQGVLQWRQRMHPGLSA